MNTPSLIIKNAQALDVRSGDYRRVDLAVSNGRISDIGRIASPPRDAAEIDADGKFLLPGLIDGHVHVTADRIGFKVLDSLPASLIASEAIVRMRRMIAKGFTSVRDCGGADFGLAMAQEAGHFPGPRLFYGGKAISQTGGHGDFRSAGEHHRPDVSACCSGMGRIADGVAEVRLAARDELRKGAHHIKIMASGGIASETDRVDSTQFSREEIAAIVEETNATNRYVAAHAYTAAAINRCLELGARSIEHGSFMDAESVELFTANHAFLVPTFATHWVAAGLSEIPPISPDAKRKAGPVWEGTQEALRYADAEGVQTVFGTDLFGAADHYQGYEFELRAQVQDHLSLVQSATLTAADLLDRTGELGVVEVGALADLIIVDRDPLDDITTLSRFEEHGGRVIQGGRLVA